MRFFVLLVFLFVAILMVAVILFQKSESSLGLGSGTMGGMMTARGTANFLTRLTAVLAAIFMSLSLWLAYMAKQEVSQKQLITQDKKLAEAEEKENARVEKEAVQAPAQKVSLNKQENGLKQRGGVVRQKGGLSAQRQSPLKAQKKLNKKSA